MLTITPQSPQQKVAPLGDDGAFTRPWYMYFSAVSSALADFIAGAVYGRPTLLNIGRITKVTGAGTIGEAAFKDTDVVLGATGLTHAGKLPKVSAAGTVAESSLTDNGTSVSGTEPIHLDTGAAPANSQVNLKANALGVLSLKCQAADNQTIGFDVDYVAAAWIAANASIGLWLKNGAQLILIGSVGNVVGNAATLTNRVIFDFATGNIDAVTGVYKVAGTQVVGARGAALTAATAAAAGAAGAGYVQATATTWVNQLLELKTRVDQLEARLSSAAGHGLFT